MDSYFISAQKYLKDMRSKMTDLNGVRDHVKEHLNRNSERRLEVPAQVNSWLHEVEKINAMVENIPSNGGGSVKIVNRRKLGRRAFKIIEEIESLLSQLSMMTWTDLPIPLGRVDSMRTSELTPSSDHNEFQSREKTFMSALKALEPNHPSHIIALVGMGGVGKTTVMEMLKKVVQDKKMFHYLIKVVIGFKPDLLAIQHSTALYLNLELKESTTDERARKLKERFKALSDGGKMKFLIILDDVWEPIDLYDIGLSPLPNQGVDWKVLLTSRNRDVCTTMGVEASSILKVNPFTEAEAQSLFHQYVKFPDDVDPDLQKIGEDILRKCSGLPIAITTMATALRGKTKDAWKDALARLEHHDSRDVVAEVIKMSYNHIENQETRSVFLLCGLFPEDFDIPIEDLVRYGWGLKLFKRVFSMREARNRLYTCIKQLMDSNLLMGSDDVGFVKMHDLVHAFVLGMFSRVEHASIVNHDSRPGWPEIGNDISNSCKTISLTCKGMSEFPSDLTFPNLTILKLMDVDESLRFPEDFYGEMAKLEVISYDNMKHPLLPSSLQCSNVRVLHLHHCSLMFDLSSIGNLLNLEVLSVANSAIKQLPSTMEKLQKLRLLDVTNCVGLRIDNGVLQKLVKLEELYLRVDDRNTISFTDDNYNEIAECSKYLSATEFEFFQNNAQPKNMLFENLERFKISMGRSLKGAFPKGEYLYENTLKLVTNKDELFKSKLNELFEKTQVLCLTVEDMNDLGDVKSIHHSSFHNLRVLVVSECPELQYLFTPGVAKTLSKLEHLEVYSCDNVKGLVDTESGGQETITFPKLKFLSLIWLPNLLGLCHMVNRIQLPQLVELRLCAIPKFTSIYPKNKLATSGFLAEEVEVPKLEKLHVRHMKNLEGIWPHEFDTSENVNVSLLREIKVTECYNLVNLFPCNPMPLLCNLEHLEVRNCGSIEVLFNIDLDCVGEIEEKGSLRSIEVYQLERLRELWRVKGSDNSRPIHGFQAIKNIEITKCRSFRNVFTPATTNLDFGARIEISINHCGESGRNNGSVDGSHEQEINVISNEETLRGGDNISDVVFPSYRIHSLCNLYKLKLLNSEGVEVVFNIESSRSRDLVTTQDNQQRLLPYLEELDIRHMDNMSHVWKCNWNEVLILQKHQSGFPFHNLTTIHMSACRSIKYLLSPLMANLLSNLKSIKIAICDVIEEVVSNRDDNDEEMGTYIHTHTTLFPRLDFLTLDYLRNLKYIGGGGARRQQFKVSQVDGVSWSLCQYSREIRIVDCHALSSVIPYYALGQMQKLRVLRIESCMLMKVVFETQGIDNTMINVGHGQITPKIPRPKNVILLQLPSLTILEIKGCGLLEHIFTYSVVESLMQLEELTVENCKAMKVIVKEECDEQEMASRVPVFRRLKSIALVNLPKLVGFFSGMNEFRWPSSDNFSWPALKKFTVNDCPQMVVFAPGGPTAPERKDMPTTNLQETPFQRSDSTSSCPPTPDIPLSFHNLTKIDLDNNKSIKKFIIPSSELLQLQILEKIKVWNCDLVEEVFEELEGTDSGFDESFFFVKLQSLRKLELVSLRRLRCIWKSNPWIVFGFPNLTKVYISRCHKLKHVFTSSMVGSLLQLQELHISRCKQMEVIVKDENVLVEEEEKEFDGKIKEIMLPSLKSLKLDELRSFKGFFLGVEDFSLPSLEALNIERCQAITMFTKGNLATPLLKKLKTSFGMFPAREGINSFISTNLEEFKRQGKH